MAGAGGLGDFDVNATVDGNDFLVWQRNFGVPQGSPPANGIRRGRSGKTGSRHLATLRRQPRSRSPFRNREHWASSPQAPAALKSCGVGESAGDVVKPTEPQRTDASPKRVLLVGWDAADWQMIHPLIEQGLMPTTASLIGDGRLGQSGDDAADPLAHAVEHDRHRQAAGAAWRARVHRAEPRRQRRPTLFKHQPQVQGALEHSHAVRAPLERRRLVRLASGGADRGNDGFESV